MNTAKNCRRFATRCIGIPNVDFLCTLFLVAECLLAFWRCCKRLTILCNWFISRSERIAEDLIFSLTMQNNLFCETIFNRLQSASMSMFFCFLSHFQNKFIFVLLTENYSFLFRNKFLLFTLKFPMLFLLRLFFRLCFCFHASWMLDFIFTGKAPLLLWGKQPSF